MTCEDVAQNEVAEKYVASQLTSAEQEAYEAHFFECRECLGALQTLQSIERELAREPAARSSNIRIWSWAIAAALAVAVLGVWTLRRPVAPITVARNPPAQTNVAPVANRDFELLARIDPPVYREPGFRGANEAQTKFREAMHHYQKADYLGAVPGLSDAARLDPKAPAILFFLGISELLGGRRAEGIAQLRKVAGMSDSLEAGDAHFYLGQALLGEQDTNGAIVEFEKAIGAKSERSKQARRLIAAIQGAP